MRYAFIMVAVIVAFAGVGSVRTIDPEPVTVTARTMTVTPDPAPMIVPVAHPKPAPIDRAMRLAAISESYLGLDVPVYPPVIEALRIDQTSDPILISSLPPTAPIERVNLRPRDVIAPEELRTIVEVFFLPEHVDLMLLVAWCESRWDTNAVNPSSGAAGLWQFMPGWFRGDWGLTGRFDPHDPTQAAEAAAKLLYQTTSGIGNWDPSRHCWG